MRKANLMLEDDFLLAKPVPHMLMEIRLARSTRLSTADVQHAFFSIPLKKGTEMATAF